MGGGIAVSYALVDQPVTIVESSRELLEAAETRVRASLERGAGYRGRTDIEHLQSLLSFGVEHGGADVSIVIEAVPEDIALKQRIMRTLEDAYADDVVLASNTSSLSITEIASVLEHPERCCGMHFFNPVPASELVEVVVGEHTADAVVDRVVTSATELGKTPIVVRDSPGFASSRLGVALGLEAIRMLESGVASAADIDAAMSLGYKHPVGPLRLTDLVGLDVRLAIAEHLTRELGPRFEPPALMRTMVADGKLGKKTGEGFYTW